MMTIHRLHNQLGELIKMGHGRKPVCVLKSSFHHNCEIDGVTILPVKHAMIEFVLNSDDDGGVKINKDGSESGRMTLVLKGDAA